MIKINEHYLKLQASYLFSDIAKRVSDFQSSHPDREIIKLGIGDVTRALPEACIAAFHQAVDEMAEESTLSPWVGLQKLMHGGLWCNAGWVAHIGKSVLGLNFVLSVWLPKPLQSPKRFCICARTSRLRSISWRLL